MWHKSFVHLRELHREESYQDDDCSGEVKAARDGIYSTGWDIIVDREDFVVMVTRPRVTLTPPTLVMYARIESAT